MLRRGPTRVYKAVAATAACKSVATQYSRSHSTNLQPKSGVCVLCPLPRRAGPAAASSVISVELPRRNLDRIWGLKRVQPVQQQPRNAERQRLGWEVRPIEAHGLPRPHPPRPPSSHGSQVGVDERDDRWLSVIRRHFGRRGVRSQRLQLRQRCRLPLEGSKDLRKGTEVVRG